ncbi:Lrp/AsnC family transcriptional regulator [Alphaproteobacteria bacterium KMM 3653]|uniref:Lrp/AsnC family transcriptional regulator n=1 Tax=Harenicola maris TaxID=2841044 RepID=A0AAP2CSM2_9RHOB|nr:Lrp/AsnC family transcriptional regulator [Harenicola maris]
MLDDFEKRILRLLQQNGRTSTQDLSDAIGLSPSPCWRRVKRLEEDGYITHYAAILSSKKLGLAALAHVHISLTDHSEDTVNTFLGFVERSEQIIDCASITGDFDFVIKVAATDPESLEHFIMKGILRLGVVRNTSTNFILRQIKTNAALPIAP